MSCLSRNAAEIGIPRLRIAGAPDGPEGLQVFCRSDHRASNLPAGCHLCRTVVYDANCQDVMLSRVRVLCLHVCRKTLGRCAHAAIGGALVDLDEQGVVRDAQRLQHARVPGQAPLEVPAARSAGPGRLDELQAVREGALEAPVLGPPVPPDSRLGVPEPPDRTLDVKHLGLDLHLRVELGGPGAETHAAHHDPGLRRRGALPDPAPRAVLQGRGEADGRDDGWGAALLRRPFCVQLHQHCPDRHDLAVLHALHDVLMLAARREEDLRAAVALDVPPELWGRPREMLQEPLQVGARLLEVRVAAPLVEEPRHVRRRARRHGLRDVQVAALALLGEERRQGPVETE
eukprot:CAMPEP_0204572950 /NCGR_PEP_ID=MMETSP0661-20131031/39745_1 /ASSEMBLY_ACC=CAM_ASM_000606 /TAXON_ID=109239 /ORGANISM="Alexandrium margalefi, Strain AMGDE01CS-322" /LENGTH=344 /DNA_ID=CAMNT_0051581331 /DNA_START=86 /DNA_END=1117 /DNA_ORIENTATION=+